MSETVVDRLDKIQLLSGLDDSEIRALEKESRWLSYSAGQQILDKDNSDRDVFFVVSGSVQVVNYSLTGREIALAKVGPGSFFGELSAIDGAPRSASVVALEECRLALLAPEQFLAQIDKHPAIAIRMLKRLAGIVRNCDERIMDLSTVGAVQRVYLHLLRLAEEDNTNTDNFVITTAPTQKAIAAIASTTRETVARSLSQLSSCQIIERQGRTIFIRDRKKLEKLAGALDSDRKDLTY